MVALDWEAPDPSSQTMGSASNADLARKLAALEKKYDAQFKAVFDAIRELMAPPEPKSRRRIGFISGD